MALDRHPADAAPAPIVAQRWDRAGPQALPAHAHRRGQLISTARGVVTVVIGRARYVAPPHRAIWAPPETEHAVSYPQDVAFRGVFVAPTLCGTLPKRPAVLQIDALTRELIEAACRISWDHPPEGPEARLMAVLLDRLSAPRAAGLELPGAADKAVARVMARLEATPADDRPLSAWAEIAFVSERTLARRFQSETGMSFAAWRERLRVIRALERLGAGAAVSTVAVELGYATPSSFATMFKRATGVTPSAYFADPPAAP